jgi:hypothetical protein
VVVVAEKVARDPSAHFPGDGQWVV